VAETTDAAYAEMDFRAVWLFEKGIDAATFTSYVVDEERNPVARPGGTALPLSVADRTLFQRVEIVRESAQVQDREPARGRGPHVGEPMRSHS